MFLTTRISFSNVLKSPGIRFNIYFTSIHLLLNLSYFLAWVRQKQLPSAVTELLQIFGALPEKPTYVCELSPTERGHLYQFNYRVVGYMLNVHHPHESIGFDWGSVYCGHEDDPCGAPDFPEPNFDIMFFLDIPPFDSKGE